ncbi:MAG: O-antigen ligase family protein [Pyrinomonadaceae bacterium]|nr:O-antigen ligase family protein [Pyrinomonadaceae bacterium]
MSLEQASKSDTVAGKMAYFLICATIVWTTLFYGTVHQPVIGLFYLVIGILALLWVIDAFRGGAIVIDKSLFQLPLAAAAIYGFVQVIPFGYIGSVGGVESIPRTISYDPFATKVAALHFVALFAFLAFALAFINRSSRLRSIVRLVTVFGFLYAFFGILQMVLSPTKIYGIYSSEFAKPFGSFVNRHNFAAYMEMTMAIPLGLYLSGAVQKDKKLLYLTAVGVMGVALVLSGSRGGLVSVVAGVAFLMFIAYGRSGRKRMVVRVIAAAAVAGAIAIGAILIGGETSFTRIAETAASKDITTNRSEIWASSAKVVRDNFVFGVGMGAFGVAYAGYDRFNGLERVEQAHNDYLEVLANTGLVGAFIGICFVFFVFRSGLRAVRSRDPLIRGASAGALSGIFAVLVHSLFDFVLHTTAVSVLFLTLVAIVGVCERLRGGERGRKRRKPEMADVMPIAKGTSA